MKKEKKSGMRLVYQHLQPKTKEEAEVAERDVESAYDILFEAVLRSEEQKTETGDK